MDLQSKTPGFGARCQPTTSCLISPVRSSCITRGGTRRCRWSFPRSSTSKAWTPGMPIELVTYPGDNHNISGNFGTAMSRSVALLRIAGSNSRRTWRTSDEPRSAPAWAWPICAVGRARVLRSSARCSRARACPSSAATSIGPGGRCRRRTGRPGCRRAWRWRQGLQRCLSSKMRRA